jgi:hypothetical protein
VLVEDAAQIRIMGFPVLEALPARGVPYQRVDPFLLVHEARLRLSDLAKVDTRHPRHPVPADDRPALWGSPDVQRPIRGLADSPGRGC